MNFNIMKMKKAFKVVNQTTSEETIVFMNPNLDFDSLIEGADDESLKGFDFQEKELSREELGSYLRQLQSEASNLKRSEYEFRNNWNLFSVPIIVSTIRGKFLQDEADGGSVDPVATFAKLAQAQGALGSGAFQTAASLVLAVEPDEYLTTELLDKISKLAISADAVANGN